MMHRSFLSVILVGLAIVPLLFSCKTKSGTEKPGTQGGGGQSSSGAGHIENQSTEQKPFSPSGSSNTCTMSGTGLTSSLNLVDARPNNSILIKVTRETKNPTTGQVELKNINCVGHIGRILEKVSDIDISSSEIFFSSVAIEKEIPVIQTSAHCFRFDHEGNKLKSISFEIKLPDGTTQIANYTINVVGEDIGEFQRDLGGEPEFYVDLRLVSDDRQKTICETQNAAKPLSSCWSFDQDIFRISPFLKRRENISQFKQKQKIFYAVTAEQKAASQIDWKETFDRRTLPTFPDGTANALWIDQIETLEKPAFEKAVGKDLVSMQLDLPVAPEGSSTHFTIAKKECNHPSKNDWNCLAQFYRNSGSSRIDSIGLTQNPANLDKGHSGTVLGLNVRTQLGWSFVEYTNNAAVLSTVDGIPVCAGDDLLCCEKAK